MGAAGGKWASATIYSLTTRLHGGGERQPCCLFRFVLLQHIERDREGAMEVLLQDYGAWRAHATKLYGDFLLSLSLTPMTTTTTTTAAAAATAAFFNIIITHLLHSHIHCDLNHSCSKLTLHDLHFFINRRKLHFPPPMEIFSLLLHFHTVGNTASFQISRLFFKTPAIF